MRTTVASENGHSKPMRNNEHVRKPDSSSNSNNSNALTGVLECVAVSMERKEAAAAAAATEEKQRKRVLRTATTITQTSPSYTPDTHTTQTHAYARQIHGDAPPWRRQELGDVAQEGVSQAQSRGLWQGSEVCPDLGEQHVRGCKGDHLLLWSRADTHEDSVQDGP